MDQALMYIAFFALAGLTLVAALAVVALRNIFRSALALMVAFIGVAGIYFLLQAEFLAVVQVLIYVGAVIVLLLFGVMLTRRLTEPHLAQFTGKWWIAAPLALALFAMVALVTYNTTWLLRPQEPLPPEAVEALGRQLMTTYVLPFEVASVLLLVALVGAIVVAWPIRDRLPVVGEVERKLAEAKKKAGETERTDPGGVH